MRGVDEEEPEVEFASRSDWNHTSIERGVEDESEEQCGFEKVADGMQMMGAINGERTDKAKGCFYKYMYGECTNKDCNMDHRDEVIQGMWKKKVWDLAKAAKTPGGEALVAELQRALRDAQASTNANTRS